MNNLIQEMKITLSCVFALYLKTHYFHWNIEGPNFHQYHSFLNDMYEEIYGSIDDIAERIRTLNAYSPGSFSRFQELSKDIIKDEVNIPIALDMIKILQEDNESVLSQLKKTHDIAQEEKSFGIVNFLEDRIDKHEKLDWKLKSFNR